jgi:PAS domain S-box-containing protein
VADVVQDANFPRAQLAEAAGLHGAFGFPIHLGEQVLGVIEFFSREIRQPNQEVLEMFSTIGGQIGQFIERKRAEAALRQLNADLERRVTEATRDLHESQERFSKAFRASPACIWIERQSDGEFVEVNEAFLQASGYSRQEVIGMNSAQLGLWGNPEDRGAFLLEVQLRGFVRHREAVWRSKTGRLDTMLLSAELIEIGARPHVLMVGLDITTRKQAEEDMRRALEQAEELSRLKTNFVTLVSHEFRTPLGIIMSAADILRNYFDRLPPHRRAEHLQDIHDATGRMAELMDEVLLLARFEAGKVDCRPARLDLRTFCFRLAEEIRSSTQSRCPINVTVAPFTGRAAADQSLMRHIFTNLLSNAVKYSPPGSMVDFHMERHDREAVFQVRDRGIGIPEEDLELLFQSFRRGGNLGEQPGSGLGLFIVKRCVDLHGGSIEIKSREDEGTTVTVRLPLFTAETTPTAPTPNQPKARHGTKTKTSAPRSRGRKENP